MINTTTFSQVEEQHTPLQLPNIPSIIKRIFSPTYPVPGEQSNPGTAQTATVQDATWQILFGQYLSQTAKINAEMEEKHMAIQTAVIESFRLLPEVNLITFQVSSNLVSLSVYTSADYLERTLLNKLLDVEISLLDTFPDHLFDFCYNFYPPDFTPGQPIIYQS